MPREGVALIGDNAQGKSNFLEAIYYLETLRSFRGARDSQMVAFGEEVFRVVGKTEGQSDEPHGTRVAAAFEKKISIANGSRNNLPEPADRTNPAVRDRHSMSLLKDAPLSMGLGIKREPPSHY